MCVCVCVRVCACVCLPNECVDFSHINVIQLLHSLLDLRFVGSQINDENQRVVVFNLLHGALGCQRVFNDPVLVQTGATGDALPRVLGPSPTLEGLWAVEVYRRVDFGLDFRVRALQHGFLGFQRLRLGLGGLTRWGGFTACDYGWGERVKTVR